MLICEKHLKRPIALNILSVLGRFRNTLGPPSVKPKAQLCTLLMLPHFICLVISDVYAHMVSLSAYYTLTLPTVISILDEMGTHCVGPLSFLNLRFHWISNNTQWL